MMTVSGEKRLRVGCGARRTSRRRVGITMPLSVNALGRGGLAHLWRGEVDDVWGCSIHPPFSILLKN